MPHINVLSKEVSELIAAGEVIDRPASVIKELLENSIDAGANLITVEIKNGGRTYMRVTDNGCGISEEDISKAFLRHATSKILLKNDLDNIMTLGFRGEALASISAVAKVEVLTKLEDEDYGTNYKVEGGEEKAFEKSGCPDGTTFIVRDIFYNVPARLKFLKKDSTEANYVANYVTKLALSHPEISFKFIKDNKTELLTAGDGKQYSGIYSVFGREFASSLIPVDYTWNNVRVYGYTVKPLQAKSNRKFQNFFVNGRYVKSKTCCVALEEAYKNNIMVGKFPACVLCIEVAPEIIDVNVHPTKIEVRFSNDKLIHEAIFFAVKDSLMKNDNPTQMQLEKKRHFTDRELYDVPQEPKSDQQVSMFSNNISAATNLILEPSIEKESSQAKQSSNSYNNTPKVVAPVNQLPEKKSNQPSGDLFLNSLYSTNADPKIDYSDEAISSFDNTISDTFNNEVQEEIIPPAEEISEFKYISTNSFEKKETVETIEVVEEKPISKPVVVGELFKTYIVAQVDEDMLLIDKHAAHERYIFEKILSDEQELSTQMFLEPFMVLLAYDEYDALSANIKRVEQLGFAIEPDVAPNIAVKGVPMILENENPTEIITELAKNFLESKNNPQLDIVDELYHSIACKAAIKANDQSSLVELQALVNLIYNRQDIKYCPHGRPVMINLTKKDIEKQFKRIV